MRCPIAAEISSRSERPTEVHSLLDINEILRFLLTCGLLGVVIFHAGTKFVDGKLTTAGGRVLAVAAVRGTLQAAVNDAYEGVKSVKFRDMYYRKDIAKR